MLDRGREVTKMTMRLEDQMLIAPSSNILSAETSSSQSSGKNSGQHCRTRAAISANIMPRPWTHSNHRSYFYHGRSMKRLGSSKASRLMTMQIMLHRNHVYCLFETFVEKSTSRRCEARLMSCCILQLRIVYKGTKKKCRVGAVLVVDQLGRFG
jgi:hypothetical protein